MILDTKIPTNNDFKMVLDKIKEVAPSLYTDVEKIIPVHL